MHIAWSELGDGPTDLVFCSAYVSHVEHLMAHPLPAALFERLARFCRVILFDRRNTILRESPIGYHRNNRLAMLGGLVHRGRSCFRRESRGHP